MSARCSAPNHICRRFITTFFIISTETVPDTGYLTLPFQPGSQFTVGTRPKQWYSYPEFLEYDGATEAGSQFTVGTRPKQWYSYPEFLEYDGSDGGGPHGKCHNWQSYIISTANKVKISWPYQEVVMGGVGFSFFLVRVGRWSFFRLSNIFCLLFV
jgi:hypothetical protein